MKVENHMTKEEREFIAWEYIMVNKQHVVHMWKRIPNKVTHVTMNVKFPTITDDKIILMEQLCDKYAAVTNLIMEANMTTGFLLGGYEFNSNHDGIRATYNELDNRIKSRGDLLSRCIVLNKNRD